MTPETASEEARKYSKSIGQGLPAESLTEIIDFSGDVTRRDWFATRETWPFWYERFDKVGLTEKLRNVAHSWAQGEENVKRAAMQVGRPYKPANKDLVLAFGFYRFKTYNKEQWELVKEPAHGPRNTELQTMICVAIDDLGPNNGFPFELKRGQDMCVDGKDALWLPPTGGGRAILIWIDL